MRKEGLLNTCINCHLGSGCAIHALYNYTRFCAEEDLLLPEKQEGHDGPGSLT